MNRTESLHAYRLKQQVGPRNSPLIKPILPKVVWDLPDEDNTEKLFNIMATVIWSRSVLNQYKHLPKGNSGERKIANNLVTKTAAQLLGNPQDISIAEKAWNANEAEQDEPQKPQEPFSELVRKERLALIKDNWEDIKPKQLAELVRIHANNDPSEDFAKDLLTNYFKGPKSRNQRVRAYYNFVSGVLNLAEEGETFKEGMKIVLHATDILPKYPSLVEQTVMLSLPYGEEESVFRKLLIARSVVDQVYFMDSYGLTKYFEERGDFVHTNSVLKEEGNKKKGNVIRKIGHAGARELNDAMMGFFRTSNAPLSKERKQELMGAWPYSVAFDETDPLNQEFQEVFASKR